LPVGGRGWKVWGVWCEEESEEWRDSLTMTTTTTERKCT
jgi:hypothetical protein